jgi:hypothetical protein
MSYGIILGGNSTDSKKEKNKFFAFIKESSE